MADELVIGGVSFNSRLIVGTGRHRSMQEMVDSLEASGTEMVTVAIRRLDLDNPEQNILEHINLDKYRILPNTAGCRTVEEALFVARLGREVAQTDFVKLEVIPDAKYLFPDPNGTLEAARQLVDDGFKVLPYIHADPVLAKNLEEVGCVTVMPLGSAIGSGQGIHTVEEVASSWRTPTCRWWWTPASRCPPTRPRLWKWAPTRCWSTRPSPRRRIPALMADAFKKGVEAGRQAYLAGRIPVRTEAIASSPPTDVPEPVP